MKVHLIKVQVLDLYEKESVDLALGQAGYEGAWSLLMMMMRRRA